MIRYDWESIKICTGGDMTKIKDYFRYVYLEDKDTLQAYLLNNEYARRILRKAKERRQSFMLNIEAFLLNNMNGTDSELFIYLDLLSRRDYFTYLNTKKKVNYLPTWKIISDYDINKLTTNRLLYIDERSIYFVYEGDLNDEI